MNKPERGKIMKIATWKLMLILLITSCMSATGCGKNDSENDVQTEHDKTLKNFSIAAIKPDDPASRRIIDNPSGNMNFSGSQESSGHVATYQGMVLGNDRMLSSGIVIGTGSCLASKKDWIIRNVTSSVTVSQSSDGFYIFTTELPEDKILFGVRGEYLDPFHIVPNGVGTVFRFRGSVKDFFDGFTFIGDEADPLCFTLLQKTGLTYVSGKGTVINSNGKEFQLPN